MSTALILLGFAGFLVGLVGLVKGGVRRMGLDSRKRSAQGLAAAFVVMMIGGALAPTSSNQDEPVARSTDRPALAAQSPSPSPSPAPSETGPPAASSPAAAPTAAPTSELIDRAGDQTALALLGTLAVKGRAAQTGYSREQFGQVWSDTDRNGCDTRNDIMKRDLSDATFKAGTRDCVVISGQRDDPYTGRVMRFTKADASALQIDHVVSLSDAWQTGAATWPAGKRLALANDPLNLIAVDGPTNASKGDGDAATWLPPNKPGRCPMVARQTAVKAKYQLWVKPAERDAIARVLATCPGKPAPTGGNRTLAATAPAQRPSQAPAPSRAPAVAPEAPPRSQAPAAREPKRAGVTPGAFCSPEGAQGVGKKNGKAYTCTRKPGEARARWRQ